MKERTRLGTAPLIRALFLALLANGVGGCANLTVLSPDPLVESPELASKRNAFELSAGFESVTKYTYTTDASLRPPTLNRWESASVAFPSMLYGRGGYSILPWLEIGLKGYPSGLYHFGLENVGPIVRVQFMGVEGGPGWKAAVYGGLLRVSTGGSGDQNGTFGNGGYNWRSRGEGRTLTAGASIGYRFEEPNLLAFAAVSYGDQKITGSIDQDRSDNGSDPGASYGLQTVQASSRVVSLGVRWGARVQLAADGGVIYRNWPTNGVGVGGAPEAEGRFNVGVIVRIPNGSEAPVSRNSAAL